MKRGVALKRISGAKQRRFVEGAAGELNPIGKRFRFPAPAFPENRTAR
jgi:hypothetical protein